jgi:flagellin-like hook-associated protein FlgL
MPAIKTNTASVGTQRQAPGSETNPNQARQRMAADAPGHNAHDDATRLAISARTAAASELVATATFGPAQAPIEDADAAKAMAEQISAQVSQQPGTAILAQANALPDQVLALLRD